MKTPLSNRTNAIRKATRTLLQSIIAAAPTAVFVARGLKPQYGVEVTAALVPVVSFCQNALEDHGIIGTFLRNPTIVPKKAAEPTAAELAVLVADIQRRLDAIGPIVPPAPPTPPVA